MLDQQLFDSQPKYLNLAHQFLDSNFLESTSPDNFSTLPIISTNPYFDSFVNSDPPMAVDYFSYKLTSKQYHNCWKNIYNNQFMKPYELSNVDSITRLQTVERTDDLMMFLPTTSQARLENACWRAWYKNLKNLKELDPTEINWLKENDVTVLYGPLIITSNDKTNNVVNDDDDDTHSANSMQSQSSNVDDLFDQDGDMKMNDESWNLDSPINTDSDSLLSQRRCSIESTRTSLASQTSHSSIDDPTDDTRTEMLPKLEFTNRSTTRGLKGILKKRNTSYSIDNRCKSKKRISFDQELTTVRIIA